MLTGGNIDPLMLGELIERGMVRAGRWPIRVDLRDLPGIRRMPPSASPAPRPTSPKCITSARLTSLPVRNVEVDFVNATRGRNCILGN